LKAKRRLKDYEQVEYYLNHGYLGFHENVKLFGIIMISRVPSVSDSDLTMPEMSQRSSVLSQHQVSSLNTRHIC